MNCFLTALVSPSICINPLRDTIARSRVSTPRDTQRAWRLSLLEFPGGNQALLWNTRTPVNFHLQGLPPMSGKRLYVHAYGRLREIAGILVGRECGRGFGTGSGREEIGEGVGSSTNTTPMTEGGGWTWGATSSSTSSLVQQEWWLWRWWCGGVGDGSWLASSLRAHKELSQTGAPLTPWWTDVDGWSKCWQAHSEEEHQRCIHHRISHLQCPHGYRVQGLLRLVRTGIIASG